MRAFLRYLAEYFRNVSRPALVVTMVLVAALVAGNYSLGIESRIQALPWYAALGAFFGFFILVIALTWGLQFEWGYKEKAMTTTPEIKLKPGRLKSIRVSSSASPAGYFKPK